MNYTINQIVIINKYKWSHINKLKKARKKAKLGLWLRIYPDEWDLRQLEVYKVVSTNSIKTLKD